MKRIISLLLVLLLWTCAIAAAEQEIVYTATVTKDMTIREKQSTSAKKLGSVEADEFIQILSFNETWTQVVKGDVVGYVLSKNVVDLADAAGYNDEAQALYLGTANKALTIRSTKSKSAMRLQSCEKDETVYILELGTQWHRVVKQGVEGFALASTIDDLRPAREGIEMPEVFVSEEPEPEPKFKANYTAQADVNLSVRAEANAESRLLATVYQDEWVKVMHVEGEWAFVKKGSETGYVRESHLRYYTRLDPYGPMIPGAVWYPYAAMATQDTEIVDAQTGEWLQTVPQGAIMAVSALDENMSVTLPYDRTTGRIQNTGGLQFETVVPWDEAQLGDLIAVFSTYYDPEQVTEEQIGRLHNIMQGVTRLNDVIVPAGEKFYFNDFCAPYTLKNGYQLGPIINYVSSQKLGYGGGICQVSTTLYNAILQIPMETIKWQVHSSYGISYAPLDFDAAVGNGNIDLRLRNSLPYDIRYALQAVGGVLTVRVYRVS